LTDNFSGKWEGERGGLKGTLHPIKPLKNRMNEAIGGIERQANKVSNYVEHYAKRERELMEKIIKAYEARNEVKAKEIAEELAELRKHKLMLINSELSLNMALLRLRTIYEFGNFISVVGSAKETVQRVRSEILNLAPDVSSELNKVEDTLNNVMLEANQDLNLTLSLDVESEEAEEILREASMLVESGMKRRFPSSPNEENK
jgi:division protein CdvB (Snf7/Vps24/ESCRT-III family)